MTEILLRCNDIELPKNGTLTLVVHPNGDVYLGDVLKDVKIGEATELLSHGRCIDADVFWKRLQKQTMILWGEKSKAYQYFLDVMDMIESAPTVLEATK